MKKIIVILLIFNVLASKAQTDFPKSKISVEVGSSFMGLAINSIRLADFPSINDCYATPVGHIAYEYFLREKFSIGIATTYQYFYFNVATNQSEFIDIKLHRPNLNFRGMYYYINKDFIHCYSGAKIGFTGYSVNVKSGAVNEAVNQLPIVLPYDPEIKSFGYLPAFQLVLFGADIMFSEKFGANVEMGIGMTYTFVAGLVVKL